MAFSTTLIIGLGGMGSKVVEGIYRKFNASQPSEIDRRNVGFLCLDTDEADVNDRKKVMPEGTVVKTSSDLSCTIGGYLDQIRTKTTVLDWFDTKSSELLAMPLNEGAAQVRMASRLAAISAIAEGKFATIDNSIKLLLATEPERHAGNNIKIHIICSLAGGTGAGSFLQTAYYVKNAMRNQGASAPKITGYFLLADVLCADSSMGLSEDQMENVRSNTYACIKEMDAFCHRDKEHQIQNVQFEYRLGQRDKSLPLDPPYDTCYLIDYFGTDGGNLIKEARYEGQAVEFVYLNAFDPIGDNIRSKAINDMRQMIDRDGAGRYGSFGVSKLVYPVDDLMSYFAHQRVVDNLSGTWQQIDKAYAELYAEYQKNINQGIRMEEPQRGKHFMDQVEMLGSTGAGREGMEFQRILRSTQVFVEGRDMGIPKAQVYLREVDKYVDLLLASSADLSGLYATCTVGNPNFTKNTGFDNDLGFVVRRERELEEYRRAVIGFIDRTKSVAIKQCLVADHDLEGFVSKNPLADANHLNTYILEAEKEMHPLAVRYMLYDLQIRLRQALAKKKAENKKLEVRINEKYRLLFDDPETKERVETAVDYIKGSNSKSQGVWNKGKNFLSGQNPYKAAKEDYEVKSKQQAEDIHKYSREKLLEETYAGLLVQINLLIEESENFFKSLNQSIFETTRKAQSLLKKHDGNSNPSVSYVLASEQIKKDIYEEVICLNDTPFFPNEMSAELYRSMFDNMVQALEAELNAISKKKNSKAKTARRLAANQQIIAKCVAFQERLIREKNRHYSEMNVLSALQEEAKRESEDDALRAHDYELRKFHAFRDRAEIWGPCNIDNSVRYINAWGIHPDCQDMAVISEDKADEFFGDTHVGTNVKTAATRIYSERFSPFEIVRVNCVRLLTVEKNYKGFISRDRTELSDEFTGNYYKAYMDVIARVNQKGGKTYSPHLDKYWHLPAYMPNIGSTQADEVGKVFRALYWGLLFGRFKSESKGGDNYWKYVGQTSYFIKDIDGRMVLTGNSLKYAIDRLFQSLTANPSIVLEVLEDADRQWAAAKELWLQKNVEESQALDKMKRAKIVQDITTYIFSIFPKAPKAKGDNWFSLLVSKENLMLDKFLALDEGRLKVHFFDELIERLIDLFGPSANTKKVCESVMKGVDRTNVDLANSRVELFDRNNRFEPQNS